MSIVWSLFNMFQSGVSLRVNLPIERRASKIYTIAMFEQFREALYKSGAYILDVAEPRKINIITHVDALAREKWSKLQFKVEVGDDRNFFNCDCGIFELSGMVCCHPMKVITKSNTLLLDMIDRFMAWPNSLLKLQKKIKIAGYD